MITELKKSSDVNNKVNEQILVRISVIIRVSPSMKQLSCISFVIFLILNGVPESVADFIQGRASVTVGSSHYLAKTKQADEWYSRIVDKFPLEVD